MVVRKRIRSESTDREPGHKTNFVSARDVQFFKFIALDHA